MMAGRCSCFLSPSGSVLFVKHRVVTRFWAAKLGPVSESKSGWAASLVHLWNLDPSYAIRLGK